MQKNSLLDTGDSVLRVLEINGSSIFVIDCMERKMPRWIDAEVVEDLQEISEEELLKRTEMTLTDVRNLDGSSQRFIQEHYTLISPLLPVVTDKQKRNQVMNTIVADSGMSKQTLRNYLCLYLVYQDKAAFAPKYSMQEQNLTPDEKNMRWALNKFYYTKHKNPLTVAYTMMLKEKYCDSEGNLLENHPTMTQFRYFYKKHRSLQTAYISRDGLKDYQRNNRPLLGDGVQEYANAVGTGMIDATICDIYLVDDAGNLIGRPILTACVDAYSSLCMGYSLSWEGGVYSLRNVALNMVTDKVEHCRKHGIVIEQNQWDCHFLPGRLVCDMGSEYKSGNFEQITELGVNLVLLPSFRPELKGVIEKLFSLIQDSFKPYLKGKGIIEPDFQERGARDYRKDACLTMEQFEQIVIRCILYYNNSRVLEKFPYTEDMLNQRIEPYASDVWKYGREQMGANLIEVDAKRLIYTLLPRTTGKFSRTGLKANKMRYRNDDFTESYLQGGAVVVAYNPDDVSQVWLMDKGDYITFDLIESRYKSKSLDAVDVMQETQKELVRNAKKENIQAKIELARHIEAISGNAVPSEDNRIKSVNKTRKREQKRTHIEYLKVGEKS